jgi:hypothetical protein
LAKGEGEMKKFYTNKMCKTFYKFQYFTVASIWGYWVLSSTGWLPWHIGGGRLSIEEAQNAAFSSLGAMPYFKCPRPVLIYALGTMGYHVFDAILGVLRERESDFWEMQLHHIATVSLIFCMIFGNNLGAGCMIAYLHDLADITVQAVKCVSCTNYSNLTLGVYFVFVSAWFWTRLFVFPQILFYVWTGDYQVNACWYFMRINAVMCTAL